MMSGDDTFDFKQKISNGFADSILASSPTKNGTMNANSLSDGCDSGEGEHDHLMHDISTKEKSGFSQSGSPSPSPDSCSPCPNGEDQDQADQYHKENNHHVNLDSVWPTGPAAVQQFTNQGGRKDGDSGFISPEGATNGAGVMEGRSLMDGASLHSDLQRQSSDGLMEFEVNRTPSLDVEIDSKPLDLSLDSDVDGLASSVQDKDEDRNEDFEVIDDLKETNQKDEVDNFSYERKPFMDNINDNIEENWQMMTKEDLPLAAGKNNFKLNDDDGLGLEQDEILEDELIKTKLELKDSTDTEKEKEVNTDDYEYNLKQDDGCQAYDPMTTSMIQTMDPMTSSMINFDTQAINHDSHEQSEIESLHMQKENFKLNQEHKDEKSYESSSEDEEDHTEKKDKEKDHSSSSSSDEDEEEKKDHTDKNSFKKGHSSSSSSSEDEEVDQNDDDMQALIVNQPFESLANTTNTDMEAVAELNKETFDARPEDNSDAESSSSDEADEVDDDDKDMGSEKDMIPYGTMTKENEGESSEDEDEKDISDEKNQMKMPLAENIDFTSGESSAAPYEGQIIGDKNEKDIYDEKKNVQLPVLNNIGVTPDIELKDEVKDTGFNAGSFTPDQYFDKTEDGENEQSKLIQDNSSSILGDVCSIPDMHNDEVKMNVEEDVFAADKSADNVHSEDEREDCPIPDVDSRNGSRRNTLSSVSSDEANEDEGFKNEKRTIESDLIATKSEEAYQTSVLCNDESPKLREEKDLDVSFEKVESKEFEVVSQNADLSNKQEETGICYEPEIDTVTQNDVAREMTSSSNDNEESEDVIMKESMVTNISEGKSLDFGFELNESIEPETKDDSPTLQTAFFESKEIAQVNNMGAFLEQTGSKIESNEYCYQKNEDTSLDLASFDSHVPAGELSSVEIVENATVSPVDEKLMVDNMSNIKETEFLVETSTNLACSQEPSGIFSQNDEHMAQKVSEFGVNGEYENSNDIDETNNCFEDNATKDTSFENSKSVEIEPVNEPKELYENTSFELNSVEKDSVFDQQKTPKDEEIQSHVVEPQTGSQHIDNESESPEIDMNTNMELSTKNLVDTSIVTSDVTTEDNIQENAEFKNIDEVKVNELGSEKGVESNSQEKIQDSDFSKVNNNEFENETITQAESNHETNNEMKPVDIVNEVEKEKDESNVQEKSVDLIAEAENEKTNIVESISVQHTSVTELAMENVNASEKGSEMDLQTGIQDSEPAIEIETTKETDVETHLTSQELNANMAQQNIETTEDVKTDTPESKLEPSITSVPITVPVEATKKVEDAAVKKTTSKPAPKAANATKTPGSASKPSALNSSLKKSEPTKTTTKPSPRPTASTPKTTVAKAGTAGAQAPAPRRSVPPAKLNTTAPKTTAANATKPGTTTKPQTNGVSRPTSATTRPTARPASARPTTTPAATKTPTSRPQTAKPSSAPAKTAPNSRPATAGTARTPTARTPLSTRTTPLTRPSPVPSTLRPRPTSTSRLRAASATRKAQASSMNGVSKTPTPASKTTSARTPLSRPSPKTATANPASTKAQAKPTTTSSRPTPSKTTPARTTPSRPTPASKRPTPATKTPTKPGTKTPATKGSNKPVPIKKPSTENAENEVNDLGKSEVSVEENVLIQHEENKVNGLSNGVHPITNGVNGVHSDEEGHSLEMNGCNGALDCTEPVQ